jgi:hypothetical protein
MLTVATEALGNDDRSAVTIAFTVVGNGKTGPFALAGPIVM